MEHIKCEVCGSEVPENARSCSACGWPRPEPAQPAQEPKVKGGRYSSKNVQRRLAKEEPTETQEPEDNRKLWIVVILLCVAIVMVSAYIALRFFVGRDAWTDETTAPIETTEAKVPCTGIVVGSSVLHLDTLGQELELNVMLRPGNTTDAVTYVSSNEAVVTVSESGVVTATGSGQAHITITCGEQTKTCTIVCWLAEETTPETTTPTEPEETTVPTEPPQYSGKVTLNREDVSFYQKNETFTFEVKIGGTKVDPSLVTWSSTDESIVSVENGKITILARGTVEITATYQGSTATCIVRCQIK